MKKILGILLAVCFLMSVTAAAVSAQGNSFVNKDKHKGVPTHLNAKGSNYKSVHTPSKANFGIGNRHVNNRDIRGNSPKNPVKNRDISGNKQKNPVKNRDIGGNSGNNGRGGNAVNQNSVVTNNVGTNLIVNVYSIGNTGNTDVNVGVVVNVVNSVPQDINASLA